MYVMKRIILFCIQNTCSNTFGKQILFSFYAYFILYVHNNFIAEEKIPWAVCNRVKDRYYVDVNICTIKIHKKILMFLHYVYIYK